MMKVKKPIKFLRNCYMGTIFFVVSVCRLLHSDSVRSCLPRSPFVFAFIVILLFFRKLYLYVHHLEKHIVSFSLSHSV